MRFLNAYDALQPLIEEVVLLITEDAMGMEASRRNHWSKVEDILKIKVKIR